MRLLYYYAHRTSRYNDFKWLTRLGCEFAPSLSSAFAEGNNTISEASSGYDLETDRFYPPWAETCSLPTQVVARLRAIDISRASLAEWRFVGQHVDALYFTATAELLKAALEHFGGKLFMRVWGDRDVDTPQLQHLLNQGVTPSMLADQRLRVLLSSPALLHNIALAPDNSYLCPTFCAKELFDFAWEPDTEAPFFSAIVPYADRDAYMAGQLRDFAATIPRQVRVKILGVNQARAVDDDTALTGFLPHASFYSLLTRSTAYIEASDARADHLRYTPVEALTMGVPVLCARRSGLARHYLHFRGEAVMNERFGVFEDMGELWRFAQAADLAAMRQLSDRQRDLAAIFSEDARASDLAALAKPLGLGPPRSGPRTTPRRARFPQDLPAAPNQHCYFSFGDLAATHSSLQEPTLSPGEGKPDAGRWTPLFSCFAPPRPLHLRIRIDVTPMGENVMSFACEIGTWSDGGYKVKSLRQGMAFDVDYIPESGHPGELRLAYRCSAPMRLLGLQATGV